jgi:septal ring factor EnvC (AmiA/AmiB activator)
MKDLDKYTAIQLQKMGNDIKAQHDALKKEIIDHTYEMQELEDKINVKIKNLEDLEKKYVMIIEKLVE